MRKTARVLAILLFVAAALGVGVMGAQRPTFRAGVRTVAVYATVSDGDGRLVPDLARSDFEVFDGGRPVDITVFSNDIQAITVAIMLDMSGSMQGNVLRVRAATEHFVNTLLPADRACIGSFGEEVVVSPLLTGDKAILKRVLHEELWPGGYTPMWQGVARAMQALEGETGRRVVLVLTDGQDNMTIGDWRGSAGDVRRQAVEASFMVYAIGIEGTGLNGGIASLAEETGGGHFELALNADLTATFARVGEELRHQYLLGFAPATFDGKLHKLNVRATRRGLKVRARKSYLASEDR
jgi:VWFA-related protein